MSQPDHLQPGFDPSKLKVAQLRGILLEYSVPYSSNAKKTELVAAYEKHIRPRAAALLSAAGTVRPSDHGILDGESQNGSLLDLDSDEGEGREAESPARPVVPKGKAKAKSKKSNLRPKSSTDEDISEPEIVREKPAKGRKSRASPLPEPQSFRASSVASEGPSADHPSSQKRKAGLDSPVGESRSNRRVSMKYESGGESGFSDFNPFQSGADDTPEKQNKKRRKSSMGLLRQGSNLAGPSTPAKARKSMPATLGHRWPQLDSPDAASSPEVHSQLTGHAKAVPSPMGPNRVSPGTKFMVPVEKMRKSSEEVRALQEQLAEYDRKIAEAGEQITIDEFVNETEEQDEVQEDEDEEMADEVDQEGEYEHELDEVVDELVAEEEDDEMEAEDEIQYEEDEAEQSSEYDQEPEPEPEPEPVRAPKEEPRSSPRKSGGYRSSPAPKQVQNLFRQEPHDRQLALRSQSSSPAKGRKAGQGRRASSNFADSTNAVAIAQPSRALATVTKLAPPAWFNTLVTVAILVSALFTWQDAKVTAGFCDPGTHTNAIVAARQPVQHQILDSLHAPDALTTLANQAYDAVLRPSCTPCPAHGDCRLGKFVTCDRDYVPREHPLKFSKMLPLAPRCVPDTEKLMVVATQASRAARILRQRKGEVICEGLEKMRKRQGRPEAWVYGVGAEQLIEALRSENKRSAAPFSEEALEETARLAIRDLEAHGEVLVYHEGEETWYASEQAEMPLSCRARLAAIDQADKHKTELGSILLALLSFLYGRQKLAARRKMNDQVRQLVKTALSELAKQHNAHFTDPVLTPTPYIVPSHLRDLVLQNEHSPARRQLLWKAVEKVVEGNANVRSKQVEQNGEEMRAWEWSGLGGGREMIEQAAGDKAGGKGLYPALLGK